MTKELKITSSRLYWLFSFDNLKLAENSIREVSKTISKSPLVNGWSYSYTPEERHEGLGKIFSDDEAVSKHLELLQDSDFYVLDEEYIEDETYTRFSLKGFKARFPFLEKAQAVDVFYTLTKWGVGSLWFSIEIDEEITSQDLVGLQLLAKKEEGFLKADVPIELIEEIAHTDSDIKPILEKRKAAGKKTFRVKDVSLGNIVGYYIYSLINLSQNRRYNSLEKIMKDQRYETYIAHPVVIIENSSPSYDSAFALVENHPKEVYLILEQMEYISPNDIAEQSTAKLFEDIITDREDIWYNSTIGSTLHIMTPRTKQIAELRAKQTEKSLDDFYLKEVLTPVIENEVVQIQRFIVFMLEYYLSSCEITDMEPREISLLKEAIIKSLDIFHGIRVVGNSISKARIDLGKEATLVNLVYDTINEKLGTMEDAVNEYRDGLVQFTQTILGIILGVVPSILLFLPSETDNGFNYWPYLKSAISIVLSGGLTFLGRFLAKVYWKRKRQKDSYV